MRREQSVRCGSSQVPDDGGSTYASGLENLVLELRNLKEVFLGGVAAEHDDLLVDIEDEDSFVP